MWISRRDYKMQTEHFPVFGPNRQTWLNMRGSIVLTLEEPFKILADNILKKYFKMSSASVVTRL